MGSFIKTALCGLTMSVADSIPGVSGSTIAFILGFYEEFMTAIGDLIGKDKTRRKVALIYLIKFAAGWALGMICCMLILSAIFESHLYAVCSLFLGLTIPAAVFIAKEEKEALRGRVKMCFMLPVGILLVVLLSSSFKPSADFAINFSSLSFRETVYLFIAGAVSITAMLLPGISGSSVLLIFGVYLPAVNAIKKLLSFDFSPLAGILPLLLGALASVLLTSSLVKNALEKHRGAMIWFILGLLIGSLYAITQGPTTLGSRALSLSTFNPIVFSLGFAVLFGLEMLKKRLGK